MPCHVSPADASAPFPAWPFPAGEVYVWVVHADDHLSDLNTLYALLSPDERERASRIHRDRDRDRWIVSRSLLRRVLGGCLRHEPRKIEFRLGPNGKPEVVWGGPAAAPHFNLSHSGGMILIAVATTPVGVDVERARDTPDLPELARHAMHPDEAAELEALPAARRPEAFVAAWTRKEAYLKARGLGLGGIRRVAVSVDPGEPATLRSADDDPDAVGRWTVVDLDVGRGYRAALAVPGGAAVSCRSIGRSGGPE